MADPMTMAIVMGSMGGAKYLGNVQANKNANEYNSHINKWAPLLAATGSKGAAPREFEKANLASDMLPALVMGAIAAGGAGAPKGTPTDMFHSSPGPWAPGTGAYDYTDASGLVSGGPGPLAPGLGAYGGPWAGGGKVGKVMHEWKTGALHSGSAKGPVVTNPKQAIAIALSEAGKSRGANQGMMVPGRARVPGDSPVNDTQTAQVSAGEGIVPRSVMRDPNPWKVAAYLSAVKKHGPGPLPVRPNGMGQGRSTPKSTSVSPWAALASMR